MKLKSTTKQMFALAAFACLTAGKAVQAQEDGLTEVQRNQRNLNAVQTVYRNGVPHTDKKGHILLKYEPGKSFFPIGSWGVPMPDERYGETYPWSTLKNAGYNLIWLRQSETPAAQAIPAAEKEGMQLILMYERTDEELKAMERSPFVMGNVWADEPTGSVGSRDMDAFFADYTRYRAHVKKVAPNVSVFVNDTAWIMPPATSWFIKWNTEADISCHDNYPVMFGKTKIANSIGADPNGIPQSVALAVGANKEKKPVWMIAGGFDLLKAREAFQFRFPSAMQMRAQVYSAITYGATGISYFIWDSWISRSVGIVGMSPNPKVDIMPGSTDSTPATPLQMINSRAQFETVAQVNHELQQLTPVILSPTVGPEVDYKVAITGRAVIDNPISCLLKPHPDGGYVLLTVNHDDAQLDVKYTFPQDLTSVEPMFENRPALKFDKPEKSFSMHYEPYEVHVLRILPGK